MAILSSARFRERDRWKPKFRDAVKITGGFYAGCYGIACATGAFEMPNAFAVMLKADRAGKEITADKPIWFHLDLLDPLPEEGVAGNHDESPA